MMRTSVALGAIVLLAAATAQAALPPQYQRARELVAVVETASGILNDPIDRVEYYGDDLYRVWAGKCRLDVQIVGTPTDETIAGPRQFRPEAGQPECD
jgi:hypothetical protein